LSGGWPLHTEKRQMKAVGYKKSLAIEDAESLLDFDAAKPEPQGRDIRVAVKAVSVNPVDGKVRKRAAPPEGETKILGYDAAGVVDAVGSEVTLFKPGDEVFYAGSILRQGTNSEFHLVDERIVGAKPKTLSFTQAAALPLTSITAWELLFDRLCVIPGKSVDPRTLLIVGGAGGVGSIMIQLARRLTALTVIATASRPESQKWCIDLGAHAVIDHARPMKEQIEKLKFPPVALIASLT
jgi:zinc-binding alcohol dehydrogenase family protein